MRARVLSHGAALQDLRLDGHPSPLVLGFTDLRDYLDHSAHHGAIAGPVINRIAEGTAAIDGTTYRFDRNDHGRQTLHGGSAGFGTLNWQIADAAGDSVTLSLRMPDGHMGFPGPIEAQCRYHLGTGQDGGALLSIDLRATTAATTLLNMGHHSYFCLDDKADIRTHKLRIDADHYLPADKTDLATGAVLPVAGTDFDFTKHRAIRGAYDNNFCVGQARRAPRSVARLTSPHSGISMDVITSEPGLQLYTGHKLGAPVAGLRGIVDGPYAGLCLEPQMWPNAPSHPNFPSILLHPDETCHQISRFCFFSGQDADTR
ncbi:MAG: aldose epimerase family protein [Candidatus Puniceispirillaceae bacterium]